MIPSSRLFILIRESLSARALFLLLNEYYNTLAPLSCGCSGHFFVVVAGGKKEHPALSLLARANLLFCWSKMKRRHDESTVTFEPGLLLLTKMLQFNLTWLLGGAHL